MNVIDFFKKIPKEVRYLLCLFLSTRIILTLIFITSSFIMYPSIKVASNSSYSLLRVWGTWDTGWYMNIVQNWYPSVIKVGASNFGFFPLYPIMIKLLSFIVQDYFISGIIISNLCLILSCFLIYKIVRLDEDEETSMRSIKYLFFFPAAFILSAVFSESLLLVLFLACFYYSQKEKWAYVGIFGFFAALTKPYGFFIIIPLLYEYAKSKGFRIKNVRLDILYLLLIPMGIALFSLYCYYLTGDYLAFVHVKQSGWNFYLSNPLTIIKNNLFFKNPVRSFDIYSVLIMMASSILFYKKLRISYVLMVLLFIFIPLSSGANMVAGLLRYSVVLFPIYILLAKISKNKYVDEILSVCLILLQGFLVAFWHAPFMIIQ